MGRNLAILIVFVFFLSPALCRGQEKASPFIFEDTSHDFGKAREDGGKLVHRYGFTNVSRDTVMITSIRSLCGCTRGEASQRVVPPGAKGYIKVVFDPYGYTGDQYKGVTVVTDRKSEDKLTFSACISPRRKSVEEEYPVLMESGLRIDKTEFNFQQLPQGQSRSLSLRYANVSGKMLCMSAVAVSGSGLLSVSCPESAAPGEKGEIWLTYTAADGEAGFHSDSFVLSAGDAEVAIKAEVAVTEDFSGIAGQSPVPSMHIGGTYVNIGTIQSSSEVSRIPYTIRNDGTAMLEIKDVLCPDGMSITLDKGTCVPPGGSMAFFVMLDPSCFGCGPVFEIIKIMSDDPSCPVKELMIAAKITR